MKKLKTIAAIKKRRKEILLNFRKAKKEKHRFTSEIVKLRAMKAYPAVKRVKTDDDYKLILTFSNGDVRMFDMKPHLVKGIFKELRDVTLFNTAHISFNTVGWSNEADIDPEVLYVFSKKVKEKKYSSPRASTTSVTEPARKYRKK